MAESPLGTTTAAAEVTVRLDGKETLVPTRAGETVLEAARRAGINPPFSCEAGNCGTCMARLVDGQVRMRVNDALSDEDLADGYVLICQSEPSTATVTVEYD